MDIQHLYDSEGTWIAFRSDRHVFDTEGGWVGWLPWEDDKQVVDPHGEYVGTIFPGDRFLYDEQVEYRGFPGTSPQPDYPGYPGAPETPGFFLQPPHMRTRDIIFADGETT